MLSCIIQYQIDPTKKAQFTEYAKNWGQAIPRCGNGATSPNTDKPNPKPDTISSKTTAYE